MNNNLYIRMTGWENDPTSDDFEGVLFVTIPPEDYMNADALQGHGCSEGYSSTHCRDGAPLTGTDFVWIHRLVANIPPGVKFWNCNSINETAHHHSYVILYLYRDYEEYR